uniref:GWxTD domain-containing protein n=1 Tax=candidate division WOR-3 bacterium TaxID=2052148 RepID=A0A7C6EB79_UNCW3
MMPNSLFYKICLALLLLYQFIYPLAFDYASFRYAKNLNLVEIYYSMPYRDLNFTTINDTVVTLVRVDYSIHSSFSADSVIDSTFRRFALTSFKEAEERDLTMVDQRNFYARPGRYWLNFTISCLADTSPLAKAKRVGFYSDTLTINDYSDSLNLSDIELAAQITTDTNPPLGDKFNKGGLMVIPNPSKQFGLAYPLINVYLEAYNMVPDTQSFEVTYAILDSNRTPIKTFKAEKRKKEGSSVSLTFAVSAKELPPGVYFLLVNLRDLTTDKKVGRYKQFFIAQPKSVKGKYHPIATEERVYYEMIHLLATEKEVRHFKKLSGIAREKFLEQFWTKHNFDEFKARVKYADLHFSLGQKLGHETDRGRIYIKYGTPDEIEDLPMTDYSQSQQKWRYYKKGLLFIFIDLYGNGNLQLIYSNSPEERNHPDWEKYVNPEEVRE